MSLKLNQARCVESRRPGRSSRGWGWEVGGARPPEAWAGARGGWGGGVGQVLWDPLQDCQRNTVNSAW